ncbi:CoA-transferase [Clostridium estertheticum]|uniref:CoA-transferase n=1 Tax=Clostridium estertheticum TaxID=238834 RepID=UPI001CF0EC70|nr:CoA-transferase [Clostridium estertheticum]MCB2362424.1 hypothetical protein [Clostridium estertheticum]
MNKLISAQEAIKKIKNGNFIMVGGFLSAGHPETLVKSLANTKVNDLAIIYNDTGTTEYAIYHVTKNGKASN